MSHGGPRQGAGRKKGGANLINAEARRKAIESGISPLEYMLGIMRDEAIDRETRFEAAKAAAPYVHARLQSTENKTEVTHRSVMRIPSPANTADEWKPKLPTTH